MKFVLSYQAQTLQLPGMLRAGGDQVDAGGLDAAVAQHVRQLRHVPADPVKGPGEQVPQVVGEHLGGRHPRPGAQGFYLRPDLPAGKTGSASGEKDLAGGGVLFFGVLQQLPAQLARQQDGADFALQAHLRPAPPGRLHGEVAHLAHPDAGGADGLQQQGQPLPAQGPGRVQQAAVLRPRQLPAGVPEQLALDAVETYALYMLKKAGAGDLAQYFLKGSDAYRAITDTERGFVQEAQSFEFVEESVTEYTVYTDNLFSARVSVTLNEYRSSGTVKESPISQTLFFEKQSSGKWMCYAMTAVDTTEATVQVRIRFVDQGREVASDLYDLSQSGISCPVVTPPEGKTFQGWGTESQDEQGNTVMNLILEPDETGPAKIPDDLLEEPLTLYAVYQ